MTRGRRRAARSRVPRLLRRTSAIMWSRVALLGCTLHACAAFTHSLSPIPSLSATRQQPPQRGIHCSASEDNDDDADRDSSSPSRSLGEKLQDMLDGWLLAPVRAKPSFVSSLRRLGVPTALPSGESGQLLLHKGRRARTVRNTRG